MKKLLKREYVFLSLIFIIILTVSVINHKTQALQVKNYLGADKCGQCHKKEYEIWQKGPHASAFDTLPFKQRENISCLWCHSTDARDNFKSYKLKGVQCEACHGLGTESIFGTMASGFSQDHKKKLREQNESVCIDCHSDDRTPSLKPFNYSQKLESIKHWE